MRTVRKQLSGWGRTPVETAYVSRPESVASLQQTIGHGSQSTYIARGCGRAYGDSALNRDDGVIEQTRLNRFLDFNENTGVLHCEAGVTISEIMQVLLPCGWFVPTTPGTQFVTVGGAIAADVHGKNHHADGSFGQHVKSLTLLVASGRLIECSPQRNADVFWATVGGMGLTGVILSARFQMRPVSTAYCDVTYRRAFDLDSALDQLSDSESQFRHSVAWVDCLAQGRSLGRSVLMLANDAELGDLPTGLRPEPLELPRRRRHSIPRRMPGGLVNRWSVKAFNAAYYTRMRDRKSIVDIESFYYPLDHLRHWNRLYGPRGFVQYQVFLPRATSRQGMRQVLQTVTESGQSPFLAVLKSCGPASGGMLSCLDEGHTLAMDLPNRPSLSQLTDRLDEILLQFGGRIYLAKDALASAETFASMYRRLGEFQAVKYRIDPETRFASSQSRRLGITLAARYQELPHRRRAA